MKKPQEFRRVTSIAFSEEEYAIIDKLVDTFEVGNRADAVRESIKLVYEQKKNNL